jgi:hypothetical protein
VRYRTDSHRRRYSNCRCKAPFTQARTGAGTTPCGRSLGGHKLFTVNADIPTIDALEHASILQYRANKLMTEAAFGDPTGHAALSADYLNEMAKAPMDDVTLAMSAIA